MSGIRGRKKAPGGARRKGKENSQVAGFRRKEKREGVSAPIAIKKGREYSPASRRAKKPSDVTQSREKTCVGDEEYVALLSSHIEKKKKLGFIMSCAEAESASGPGKRGENDS